MSTPLQQRPVRPARPAGGAGGLRGPGLSQFPPSEPSSGGWLLWLVLTPLLLMLFTWLLGRTVEQVRVRLEPIPLAGKLLFADPVWPILWNKRPEPPPATEAPGSGTAPENGAALPADYAELNAQIAARLAAVESREAALSEKERALKEMEAAITDLQREVNRSSAEVAGLKLQLQGQLRTELDRVAVVRGMKTSAQVQLFAAMTDDEVLSVIKYMEPDEVGKILASMDAWRSARILHRLTQIGASP